MKFQAYFVKFPSIVRSMLLFCARYLSREWNHALSVIFIVSPFPLKKCASRLESILHLFIFDCSRTDWGAINFVTEIQVIHAIAQVPLSLTSISVLLLIICTENWSSFRYTILQQGLDNVIEVTRLLNSCSLHKVSSVTKLLRWMFKSTKFPYCLDLRVKSPFYDFSLKTGLFPEYKFL